MEARSVRLQDLDFDRKQLKVVQGKGKKDRYTTFDSFDTRIKKYIAAEKPIDYLFNGQPIARSGAILTVVTANERAMAKTVAKSVE
jgi:integrase